MSRTGHYLKPARRVTSPGVVFSICCDTEIVPSPNTSVYREQEFKAAVATVTRRKKGKWSKPKLLYTESGDELRKWIHENAAPKLRNYVICPTASDVLTLTSWWDYAERQGIVFIERIGRDTESITSSTAANGIQVRRCVLRGKPDIFDINDNGKRYVYLSGVQYFDMDERALGESIGFRANNDLLGCMHGDSDRYSLEDRALLWSQVLCQLAQWWSENSTAPFGLTLGSMAMGILRSHIKPKTISTHNDSYIHTLERSACYGGRASVWYVGSIGSVPIRQLHRETGARLDSSPNVAGPIRLIDVRSMYPYLLSNRVYPCRYVGRIGKVSPAELLSLSEHYGIIASCTLYSWSGEYPTRTKNGITYPRGYIHTTLTSPEIRSIRGRDKLLAVHDGALYTIGEPFKEAATELLNMRLEARAKRRTAWELFAKSVANNLGGRLAMRRGTWKPRPDIAPARKWGEWIVSEYGGTAPKRMRAICGLVYEYVKDEKGYGPYSAAFAYLTAYGRIMMREIRESCAPNSVVSQDTDGIWLLGEQSYRQLQGTHTFGNLPGQLQVKELSHNGIFLDPKHYWTDAGWVLAGFREFTVDTSKLLITDLSAINPATIGARETPRTLLTKLRTSRIAPHPIDGTITPDGWVNPRYIAPPKEWIDQC